MKTFSELLSDYIRRLGISDAELARTIGVRRQTIFRWREGLTARPRQRDDVLLLAKKLRLAPDERDALLLSAGFSPQSPEGVGPPPPAPVEARPPSKHPPAIPVQAAADSQPVGGSTTVQPGLSDAADAGQEMTPAGVIMVADDRPVWRQRPKLIGGILLFVVVLGLTGLMMGSNLIGFDGFSLKKPTPTSTAVPSTPTPTPTPFWGGIRPAQPGETLILVTNFVNYAGDQVGYNVAGRLVDALEEEIETANLEGIRLAVWPEPIGLRRFALQAGQTVSATLIIYGEYDFGRVKAQFAQPAAERSFVKEGLLHEVADLQDLSAVINSDLPQQARSLAWLVLGQIYISQGQIEQAGRVLQQAHRHLQGDPEADEQTRSTLNFYLGIAYAQAEQPQFDKAIVAYSEALDIRPGLISARLNRSAAYQGRQEPGDLNRALADIDQVVAAIPDWAAAYNNRAAILMDLSGDNNLARAKADLNQALTLDPNLVSAYINRAILRFQQGQLVEGWKPDIDAALALQPEHAGALNMLCWGYAVEEKADLAMSYCERAVSIDPRPMIIDSRGLANALLGNTEEAIADFEVYIRWLEGQPSRQTALAERRAWVEALKAGENPFTPEAMARLRNQ